MLTSLAISLLLSPAMASSHREAPSIALDPTADITDLYAFLNPNDTDQLVILMNVNPLQDPGGGPNFHGFDENVRYTIHIDHDGDGIEDMSWRYEFDNSAFAYGGEWLYNFGDVGGTTADLNANLNSYQTYTVQRYVGPGGLPITVVNDGVVAPAHVGDASNASGGYTPTSTTPGQITADHTIQVSNPTGDYQYFAGPRQEGFFVDLGKTFDLLAVCDGNPNVNTLLGKNISTIGLEVPVKFITRDGNPAATALQNEVVAIWATTSRQKAKIHFDDGSPPGAGGPWVQVARLGNPLINEVGIGLADKDLFNASHPSDDIQFAGYVTSPTLPVYLDALCGVPVPINPTSDPCIGTGGREDLVMALLTGHPALGTQPASASSGFCLGSSIPGTSSGEVFVPFDALRINLDVRAAAFDANATDGNGSLGYWPNGRWVEDDVVDVALSAFGGLLIDGTTVSDGVDATGLYFLTSFPFLGDPWSGSSAPFPAR
jgi:hypothetical protein